MTLNLLFLLTQSGISLLNIVEERPRHFAFILSNPKKCEELKQKYLNGAKASALNLFQKKRHVVNRNEK